MVIVRGVASRRESPSWSWLLIGWGFGWCSASATPSTCCRPSTTAYLPNGMLDLTWPTALALVGSRPGSRTAPRHRATPAATIVTPVALSMLDLALLIIDHFQRTNLLALCWRDVHTSRLDPADLRVPRIRKAARANAIARDQAVEALNAKALFVRHGQPRTAQPV